MIWEQNLPSPRETLAEAVLALCASAGVSRSGGLAELADGVARRAEELAVAPARRAELSRLTARALGSLGRPEAARRVLVAGSDLVRPACWLAAPADGVWTLDLTRLLRREADHLELALYPGLSALLDVLAVLWDDAGGAGVLGLAGADDAARRLFGPAADRERRLAFRRELGAFCGDRLAALAAARGWRTRPHLLFTNAATP